MDDEEKITEEEFQNLVKDFLILNILTAQLLGMGVVNCFYKAGEEKWTVKTIFGSEEDIEDYIEYLKEKHKNNNYFIYKNQEVVASNNLSAFFDKESVAKIISRQMEKLNKEEE